VRIRLRERLKEIEMGESWWKECDAEPAEKGDTLHLGVG